MTVHAPRHQRKDLAEILALCPTWEDFSQNLVGLPSGDIKLAQRLHDKGMSPAEAAEYVKGSRRYFALRNRTKRNINRALCKMVAERFDEDTPEVAKAAFLRFVAEVLNGQRVLFDGEEYEKWAYHPQIKHVLQWLDMFDLWRTHDIASNLADDGCAINSEEDAERFLTFWTRVATPERPLFSDYNPSLKSVWELARAVNSSPAIQRLSSKLLKVCVLNLEMRDLPYISADRLKYAAKTWRIWSGIPFRLASQIGRMSLRGRLIAIFVWRKFQSQVEQGGKEPSREEYWWEVRRYLEMPTYRVAHEVVDMWVPIGWFRRWFHLLYRAFIEERPWDEVAAITAILHEWWFRENSHLFRFSPKGYKAVIKALGGEVNENTITYGVLVSLVFGRRAGAFLQRAKTQMTPHEACQLVPRESLGMEQPVRDALATWLLRHVHEPGVSFESLRLVTQTWSDLYNEVGPEIVAWEPSRLNRLALKLKHQFRGEVFSAAFISEALKWGYGYDPSEVSRWQIDWLKSVVTPSPFPLHEEWREGEYRGRFLPRYDVRGLFLGQYTRCCQHPSGAAATSALHGQADPTGGFFVVEDPQGKVVAMSWVWWRPGEGVCFDNIEATPETYRSTTRSRWVVGIYTQAAKRLAALGFGRVTVGKGHTDISDPPWATAECPLAPPRGFYTDARNQWVLVEAQATRGFASPAYTVDLRLTSEIDDKKNIAPLQRIAEACYPPGWQFISPGDIVLTLYHHGEDNERTPVGYAIIGVNRNNYEVCDLAIVPGHRRRGFLTLMNALLDTLLAIEPGATWVCDARYTTSYPVLCSLHKRGRITILHDEPSEQEMDGYPMRRVSFTVNG